MKHEEFDNALRSAMPILESDVLDEKVTRALARSERRTAIRRRYGYATAGAMGLVVVALVLPVAGAQAGIQAIAGALDDVDTVRMVRYSIGPGGARRVHGSIDYDRGRWRLETSPGDLQIYRDGTLWMYEPVPGVFVKTLRPEGPFSYSTKGIGLSSMLQSGSWGSDARITMSDGKFKGRDVRIATILRRDEKSLIYADRKTDRPIEAQFLKGDTVVESMAFDYKPAFAPTHFDPDTKIRVMTEEQLRMEVSAEMTRNELAVRALDKGRFVLRKVDCAKDGTVFVSYQAGDKSNSWRGFRLILTDDLVTEYAAPKEPMMRSDARFGMQKESKDGRLDQEIFVPTKAQSVWKPRKLTLSAQFTTGGKMVQFIYGFSKQPSGKWLFKRFPNTPGTSDTDPIEPVWSATFKQPTCEWSPSYMRLFDYSGFASDFKAQIYRAEHVQASREFWRPAKCPDLAGKTDRPEGAFASSGRRAVRDRR